MEVKDIKVTIEGEVKHLDIRHGKLNDIHIPGKISLSGFTIEAVKEFLQKEGIENEKIKDSYIDFSVENRYIALSYNSRAVNPDNVKGVLRIHPDLETFQINSGKQYTTHALAQFIRMNRHYFETKDIALKLVTELQNFVAKVNKEIESSDDKKANVKMMIAQKVVSNIPTEFNLMLPIFLGSNKTSIKVEIDIDAQDLTCTLVSPDLKELIDNESKAIIDNILLDIKKLYPQLKIFQA